MLRGLTAGAGFVVAVLALTALAHAASNRTLVIPLSGFHEAPSTLVVPGKGVARLKIEGTTISYDLTYEGLASGVTQAHIHIGEDALVGGVAAFLCTNLGNGPAGTPACPSPAGRVTGSIDAADVVGPAAQGLSPGDIAELQRALRRGAIYVNVHSTAFPAGELRGNAK